MERSAVIQDLLRFLSESPTAFHATRSLQRRLEEAGFVQLQPTERWTLQSGGKYFLQRNDSALIAFMCGTEYAWKNGFRLLGAHTDSPCLRFKPRGDIQKETYALARIEVYGSTILSTWLDRELSLAGRIQIRDDSGKYETRLVDFKEPIAMIPNLAIHLNREVNKGFEYNPHTHLSPLLLAGTEKPDANPLLDFIAKREGLTCSNIVEADLVFYDATPGRVGGLNNDLLFSGRLDNLAMCHAISQALVAPAATNATHTTVAMFFDNEEVGSQSFQGADSSFARDTLERIVISQRGDREHFMQAMALSFLVSADMAHALHPSFAEKHDDKYAPVINGGPVIKQNGNLRYATSGDTAALFERVCREAEVPSQRLINRADMPCGSTIGPMSTAHLGVRGVDVGNPMFAMHSVRETMGTTDHEQMVRALTHFCTHFKI